MYWIMWWGVVQFVSLLCFSNCIFFACICEQCHLQRDSCHCSITGKQTLNSKPSFWHFHEFDVRLPVISICFCYYLYYCKSLPSKVSQSYWTRGEYLCVCVWGCGELCSSIGCKLILKNSSILFSVDIFFLLLRVCEPYNVSNRVWAVNSS